MALEDKKYNNQSSQEKKSLNNIATIFQMNNMKKDFKNIFNNELISSENFNKKIEDSYKFIIPLNNSIDEKIGLDKIEFIEQRDFFANLNNNNLELLNKKTTADHTIISNFQQSYPVSNNPEKTENINFELDFLTYHNANEDFVNMKSNKKFYLHEKDCVIKAADKAKKNVSFVVEEKQIRKTSDNNSQNELNEDMILKVKASYPAAHIGKVNNLKSNKQININDSYFDINDNINNKNKDYFKNGINVKTQISKKNLNVSMSCCDYEENVFEENSTNTNIADANIKNNDNTNFLPLSRYNSKRDIDATFIKNSNNLTKKLLHCRVNSCDDYDLLKSKYSKKTNKLNIQKIDEVYTKNYYELKLIHKRNFSQEKCDMETHYYNNIPNYDIDNNYNKNSKANIIPQRRSDIENYSYHQMKNSYKNIENYASPNLDNTIIKHKLQKQEQLEREKLSKFLNNAYLSSMTQEKTEKELANFSSIQKNFFSNNNNIYNNNNNNHNNNYNPEDNLNIHSYLSIKKKLDEFHSSNFNNNNITPNKTKSISPENLNNAAAAAADENNFQNDSLEPVKNSGSNLLNNKNLLVPKTYKTIQSQTESDNKTVENQTRKKSKNTCSITAVYEKKNECVCSKLNNNNELRNNFNPNSSLRLEHIEGNQPDKSEINICPECEVHQIPKVDIFSINMDFVDGLSNKDRDICFRSNAVGNSNQYIFSTSLKSHLNNKAQNQYSNNNQMSYNIENNIINTNANNNNNNISTIAQHFNSNPNKLKFTSNSNLRNSKNLNNLNNDYLSYVQQTGFLNTNISNQFTNFNNVLHTRSYSNNLGQKNNDLISIDNSNLLSEAHLFRQSRSLNNKDDFLNPVLNRISINSIQGTNEEDLFMGKAKNLNTSLNNEKPFMFGTYNPNVFKTNNNNNNICSANLNLKNSSKNYVSQNSNDSKNNENNIYNFNNNYKKNHNTNNFINYNLNNINTNNNNDNNEDNHRANPHLNMSESINKNYQSYRESAENKIFYSCSPPSSIRKQQKGNLKSQNEFFSLKQQNNQSNNSNNNLYNENSLDDLNFNYKNKNAIFEANNNLNFLNLTKEFILLKKEKTNAELLNKDYETELKLKNLQLENLKNKLTQSKVKNEADKSEVKRLEMTISILNSKNENQVAKAQWSQKSYKTNASGVNFNNISNYLTSSLNKSCVVNRNEVEIKKSIKMINKNVIMPKLSKSKKI